MQCHNQCRCRCVVVAAGTLHPTWPLRCSGLTRSMAAPSGWLPSAAAAIQVASLRAEGWRTAAAGRRSASAGHQRWPEHAGTPSGQPRPIARPAQWIRRTRPGELAAHMADGWLSSPPGWLQLTSRPRRMSGRPPLFERATVSWGYMNSRHKRANVTWHVACAGWWKYVSKPLDTC